MGVTEGATKTGGRPNARMTMAPRMEDGRRGNSLSQLEEGAVCGEATTARDVDNLNVKRDSVTPTTF